MKYRIIIRHNAEKELGRLGHEEQRRISKKFSVWKMNRSLREPSRYRAGKVIAFALAIIAFFMKWMNHPSSSTSQQSATGATFIGNSP